VGPKPFKRYTFVLTPKGVQISTLKKPVLKYKLCLNVAYYPLMWNYPSDSFCIFFSESVLLWSFCDLLGWDISIHCLYTSIYFTV